MKELEQQDKPLANPVEVLATCIGISTASIVCAIEDRVRFALDSLMVSVAQKLSADKMPMSSDGIDAYDRKPGKVSPLKPQLQGHKKRGCFLR